MPGRPTHEPGKRTVKSPFRIVFRLSRMMRSSGECSGRALEWPLAGARASGAETGSSGTGALRLDFFTWFSNLEQIDSTTRDETVFDHANSLSLSSVRTKELNGDSYHERFELSLGYFLYIVILASKELRATASWARSVGRRYDGLFGISFWRMLSFSRTYSIPCMPRRASNC